MLIVEGVLTCRSVVSVHLLVLSNQLIGICRASLVLHATLMGLVELKHQTKISGKVFLRFLSLKWCWTHIF